MTGDHGLLYFPRRSRGKYRPMVSSQRGELFCTISQLKSIQYLFYITYKNILAILCFLWRGKHFNPSKCQPKKSNASTMQAHRSGPSLGLVKLSSKSTVRYSNSTIYTYSLFQCLLRWKRVRFCHGLSRTRPNSNISLAALSLVSCSNCEWQCMWPIHCVCIISIVPTIFQGHTTDQFEP